MNHSVDQMLDNAAAASQQKEILNNPVVRGAIIRSVWQWIILNPEKDIWDLKIALQQHEDFNN